MPATQKLEYRNTTRCEETCAPFVWSIAQSPKSMFVMLPLPCSRTMLAYILTDD